MRTPKRTSALVGLAVLLIASCGGNEGILRSGKETPTPPDAAAAPSPAPMEKELTAMRNADFDQVYLVRRTDGQKLDAADREFVKGLTQDANRRVLTGDDMAIVIGMNSQLPPDTLSKLSRRFAVDIFPELPTNANGNSNADK